MIDALIAHIKSLKTYERILLVGFVASVIGLIIISFERSGGRLWDFRVYYSAALCYREGLTPYEINNLFKVHTNVAPLPFLYPPLTIFYFIPISYLGVQAALYTYLSLKLLAVVALFRVWFKLLPTNQYWVAFLWLGLFAFNAALLKDIETGNISVFEQLGIWWAVYFWLQEKPWKFALLILIVASFKLMPAIFLGFLFFSRSKNKWKVFFTSCGIFGLYLLSNWLIEPELTEIYLSKTAETVIRETGIVNASSLEFFYAIFKRLIPNGFKTPAVITYLLFVVVVGVCSIRRLAQRTHETNYESRLEMAMLLCLSILLVLPRFKDYSYILAILPTFYLITRYRHKVGIGLIVIVVCLSAYNLSVPFFKDVMTLMWQYYTLIIAFVGWYLYLQRLQKPLPETMA